MPDPAHTQKEADPADRTIIGWREYVALPRWNVRSIRAKIDTGARTSAIDVDNIQTLPGNRVRFEIMTRRNDPDARVVVETEVIRTTRVRSSFGAAHDRIVVRTVARIGSIDREIELGLVSRRRMLCRVLLGRHALGTDFIVDPSRRYVHGRAPRSRSSDGRTP